MLQVGDRVTRDGTDIHVVVSLLPDAHSGEFRCELAPASGWCKVGDVEFNLASRYRSLTVSADGSMTDPKRTSAEVQERMKADAAMLARAAAQVRRAGAEAAAAMRAYAKAMRVPRWP